MKKYYLPASKRSGEIFKAKSGCEQVTALQLDGCFRRYLVMKIIGYLCLMKLFFAVASSLAFADDEYIYCITEDTASDSRYYSASSSNYGFIV